MARTYKRDSRGRFASGGGSSSRGGGRKPMQRGTNRLTRDNAGRITSVGGDGATARGGRLRTASGKQRATVTAKGIGKAPAGTVGRRGQVKGAARVKAAGRRAPLTGVNAVVARNPAGFKGLPVSLRSRSEAAAAQRQRNIGRLRTAQNSPSRSYITLGSDRGGEIATGSMRIRKGKSEQGNLLTGKTETVVSGRRITMSGRSALGQRAKPAAAAVKPARRQRVRGNFRPKNLLTRTDPKSSKGYGTDAKANVAEARRRIASKGATSVLKSNKRSSSVGSVSENSPNTVNINASHTAWRNPRRDMIKSRRKNEFSTSSANHYAAHELGHVRNPTARMASNWSTQLRGKGQVMADSDKVVQAQRVALRVSRYARQSPAEFTAEVSAALSSGKKFDNEVMRQYRKITGRSARSIRSQMAAANPRRRR